MKIAVIGAGISGLAAANELVAAGHEVVVFEQEKAAGGRLSSIQTEKAVLDHGVGSFQATSAEFRKLVTAYTEKGVLTKWEGKFARMDENGDITPNETENPQYYAPKGMAELAKQMGRMLDIRFEEKVGGLTHIGENRRKKRSWMLNFPTALTESADAVIIATPARKAYALLNTTIDEIDTLKLVREIDEVEFESQFTFMGIYDEKVELPEWNVLECDDDIIASISNESNKRNGAHALVVQTTSEFAKSRVEADRDETEQLISDRLAQILDGWAALPEWKALYFWKYSQAINPLPYDFMEIKGKDTPLALVGGYMNGNSVESAYLSGLKLGKHWADMFKD